MDKEKAIKPLSLKALKIILGLLIILLVIYIFGLPFYPEIKYRLFPDSFQPQNESISDKGQADENLTASSTALAVKKESLANEKEIGNRLVIKKIGVDIPIIEAPNSDQKLALNRGAWRMPETSTPDKGSNTVLTGHRFKYLPPSNLTFYLLDKLTAGDEMEVFWNGKKYIYRVTGSKIVLPTEVSVLAATAKSILTLITCDPIFSQKNRLIVAGELTNS